MKIEIWSIGKKNDSYIQEGIAYYFNKIKHYDSIELVIIDNKKISTNNIETIRKEEEKLIMGRLNSNHKLILLDERGKSLDSPQFAKTLNSYKDNNTKVLVFLIGGAYGVTETIHAKADLIWSFSKLVFPHQLMRLILSEQIFRAYSIINNSGYHHQ